MVRPVYATLKLRIVLSGTLLTLMGCLSESAMSDSLDDDIEKGVEICVSGFGKINVRQCLDSQYYDCVQIYKSEQCYYNVSYKAYEYYLSSEALSEESRNFIQETQRLVYSNCFEIADSEIDRAAKVWAKSKCMYESRILSLLADNVLLLGGYNDD